jgi:ribosomal protein S6--L-glutamate ligase
MRHLILCDLRMGWISFDPLRTLGFPDTRFLKPEQCFSFREELVQANWVLFPDYWQVNALVYGFGSRIFPSHSSYLIGHSKVEMTRAFTAVAPRHVPETHIAANTPEQAAALWARMTPPFVAKLPRSAQGQGVWLIESQADWRRYLLCADVLYVQEYLPIDRDIRLVLIGNKVISHYWRLQSPYTFHNNVSRGGEVDYSPVPAAAIALVEQVASQLGINHAGFDVAMVGGHPYLLEFNRLFGNQGIPGGDLALRSAILDYLKSHEVPQRPTRDSRRAKRLRRAA